MEVHHIRSGRLSQVQMEAPTSQGQVILPPEVTGDLGYLRGAAPAAPHPTARWSYVGDIGWGWQYNQLLNSEALLSDMQIKKTEVRMVLEARAAQQFLNTD